MNIIQIGLLIFSLVTVDGWGNGQQQQQQQQQALQEAQQQAMVTQDDQLMILLEHDQLQYARPVSSFVPQTQQPLNANINKMSETTTRTNTNPSTTYLTGFSTVNDAPLLMNQWSTTNNWPNIFYPTTQSPFTLGMRQALLGLIKEQGWTVEQANKVNIIAVQLPVNWASDILASSS
jgi:hypothetical protein